MLVTDVTSKRTTTGFASTALSVVCVALLTSACGGGGGGSVPASAGSGTSPATVGAILRVDVPAATGAARSRRPNYISASTQSIAMTFTPASGGTTVTIDRNLTPATNPNCARTAGAVACTISFQIAPGTYVGAVGLYDGPLSTQGVPSGNEVSSGQSVAVTFASGQSNIVALTLDGVPKNVVVSSTSPALHIAANGDLALYGTAPQTVHVNALDADGNTIAGPGSPSFALTVTGGNITATTTTGSTNSFTLTPAGTPATVASGLLAIKATSPGNGCAQTGAVCSKTLALSNHVQDLFVSIVTLARGTATFPTLLTFRAPYFATTPQTLNFIDFFTVVGNFNAIAADAAGQCVVATPPAAGVASGLTSFSAASAAGPAVSALQAPASSALFDPSADLFSAQGAGVVEFAAASISGVLAGSPNTTVAPTTTTVPANAAANPIALTMDAAADLFVLNAANNTVTVYAPPYTTATTTIATPTSATALFALDAKGDLFVENGTTVSILAPPYGAAEKTITSSSALSGLAVDAVGDVFVAAAGNVLEYAPPWSTPVTLPSSANPVSTTGQSLAIDGVGDLFVVTVTPATPSTYTVVGYAPPYAGVPAAIAGPSIAYPVINLTP